MGYLSLNVDVVLLLYPVMCLEQSIDQNSNPEHSNQPKHVILISEDHP